MIVKWTNNELENCDGFCCAPVSVRGSNTKRIGSLQFGQTQNVLQWSAYSIFFISSAINAKLIFLALQCGQVSMRIGTVLVAILMWSAKLIKLNGRRLSVK